MLTLELCDEYRNTGAPSCAAWLAGTSDQPPDHVCYGAAADSTARWAEERELKLLVGLVGKGGVFSIYWYAGMWPLPVGARSLEHGVVIQCCQEIGFWGGEVPTLLSPPSLRAAPDDAWLGLVARRQTRAGTAWLFGLLEMGFVIMGAATGLNFFNVRTWEDDFAPGVENFVRCSPDGGAVESMERWRWVGHIVLIEASPAKPGELAALAAEADKLTEWYNATLLGKEFKTRGGGRPVGSKEYWQNRESFVLAVRTAIKAIKAQGGEITQERVHEYLALKMATVPRPHAQNGYSLRQFQRDRADYGFSSWEALRDFCTD